MIPNKERPSIGMCGCMCVNSIVWTIKDLVVEFLMVDQHTYIHLPIFSIVSLHSFCIVIYSDLLNVTSRFITHTYQFSTCTTPTSLPILITYE